MSISPPAQPVADLLGVADGDTDDRRGASVREGAQHCREQVIPDRAAGADVQLFKRFPLMRQHFAHRRVHEREDLHAALIDKLPLRGQFHVRAVGGAVQKGCAVKKISIRFTCWLTVG